MDKIFSHLYARAFCHATEDVDKVKSSIFNVTGDPNPTIHRTEGAHGNPICILESHQDGQQAAVDFLKRLTKKDLSDVLETIDKRLDDGCNLFIRLDKQMAYGGSATVAQGEDVVLIRIKVLAYPSRPKNAAELVRKFVLREFPAIERVP